MDEHWTNPEALYSEALAEFENNNYDSAVGKLIALYESGFHKETILEDLYNCFVNPNESEFADNYRKQTENIHSPFSYAELPIDFFPVSDTLYYIYNRRTDSFHGKIDLAPYLNDQQDNRTFQSLLICDLWNPTQFLQQYCEKEYQKTYICLEENTAPLFYSFYKLPDFLSAIDMDRTVIFFDSKEYSDYFYSHADSYIPHVIYGKNVTSFQKINQELHSYRLANPSGGNIFLTIAIPTYNRGQIALDAIKQLLTLNYDSEIEILISNNGSTKNTDGYKEIAAMADSRITYFEFEENQEYIGNIENVLSIGKGRFIMVASDEDRMYLPNLGAYLDFLYNHTSAGYVFPSGTGDNMHPMSLTIFTDPVERFIAAFNQNYLTGLTFNSQVLKANSAFSRIRNLVKSQNLFALHYVHIVYALIACEQNYSCHSDILLWDSPEDCKSSNEALILEYMRPDNRLAQLDSAIELIFHFLRIPPDPKISTHLFYGRIAKTFWVLFVAFWDRPAAMTAEYDWLDTCIKIWEHNNSLIQHYNTELDAAFINWLLEQNVLLFKDYIVKNPSESIQNPEQLRSYELRRDKLLNT